jgi:hypothetical protein
MLHFVHCAHLLVATRNVYVTVHQCKRKYSVVEKPAKTQISNRLASHLVSVPNSRSGGHEFGTRCTDKKWKDSWSQVFLQW